MAKMQLNRPDLESKIRSAFRRQFPTLHILLDGERVTIDNDGILGFNPIPDNEFCGAGTYSMHGWVKVIRRLCKDGWQSCNTKFDVIVTIENKDDELDIKFSQPIFLKIQ